MQWAFDHPGGGAGDGHGGSRVSMVMSGADDRLCEKNGSLVDRGLSECRRYFPEARGVPLRAGLVLKSRRATFLGSVGQRQRRAACRSPYANMMLAGDWTDTGLPATMEGAIMSGNRAACALLPRAGRGDIRTGCARTEAGFCHPHGVMSLGT
jgi:uncharacterized protein with NAD-binding domain and iron-sulfur cluster